MPITKCAQIISLQLRLHDNLLAPQCVTDNEDPFCDPDLSLVRSKEKTRSFRLKTGSCSCRHASGTEWKLCSIFWPAYSGKYRIHRNFLGSLIFVVAFNHKN